MTQHSRTFEMMSVLVIVITVLVFLLFIHLVTNFYTHMDDINYFKNKPGVVASVLHFLR
jgi:hypothetical protein